MAYFVITDVSLMLGLDSYLIYEPLDSYSRTRFITRVKSTHLSVHFNYQTTLCILQPTGTTSCYLREEATGLLGTESGGVLWTPG